MVKSPVAKVEYLFRYGSQRAGTTLSHVFHSVSDKNARRHVKRFVAARRKRFGKDQLVNVILFKLVPFWKGQEIAPDLM